MGAADPAMPVDVQFDFGKRRNIKSVEIDWEHAAQAYELQVSTGGQWKTLYKTAGNNLQTTRYLGPSTPAAALRIHMTMTHPTLGRSSGQPLYAIKSVRVFASSAHAGVQDCNEAEENTDARDKLFMVAVPAFAPSIASAAKERAALLNSAQEHLGTLLAELYIAMPSLAACDFKASLAKRMASADLRQHAAKSGHRGTREGDATSIAVATIGASMGVDLQATHALVTKAREAFAQVA